MLFLVFDTETTGLPKHPNAKDEVQPRVIEFGGILCDETGEQIEHIEKLINPGQKLEAIITKITGLTDDDLAGAPSFDEAAPDLARFFRRADAIVAHNLPFDYTLMEMEIARHGIDYWEWPSIHICTVQEHAEEYGRRPRLIELYEDATGEKLHQTHRALDDVEALIEVCKRQGIFNAAATAYSN